MSSTVARAGVLLGADRDRIAARLGDRFLGGVVLGTADQGVRFGENFVCLPIASLWEL